MKNVDMSVFGVTNSDLKHGAEKDPIEVGVQEVDEPDNDTAIQVVNNNIAIFDKDPVKAFNKMKVVVESIAKELTGEVYISIIQNNPYPRVEWWTTVGGSLGLFPVVEWTKRIERDDDEIIYKSRVTVRHNGMIVTAGESLCSNRETGKEDDDEYSIMSMSETRATSKAYKVGLSMLAVMAGLKPTPAEEVPQDGFSQTSQSTQQQKSEWDGTERVTGGKYFDKETQIGCQYSEIEESYLTYMSGRHKPDSKWLNKHQAELDRRAAEKKANSTTTNFDFLKAMEKLKSDFNDTTKSDDMYYTELKKHGFEKSNEITSPDLQKTVYRDMRSTLESIPF